MVKIYISRSNFSYRWEQWVVPVLVNNTPRPVNDDTASKIERQRIQVKDTIYACSCGMLRLRCGM